jgi:hypothetical protein
MTSTLSGTFLSHLHRHARSRIPQTDSPRLSTDHSSTPTCLFICEDPSTSTLRWSTPHNTTCLVPTTLHGSAFSLDDLTPPCTRIHGVEPRPFTTRPALPPHDALALPRACLRSLPVVLAARWTLPRLSRRHRLSPCRRG